MTTPLSSAPSPAPLRRGLANLLGDALDLFIAPAYSAPGFAVRSAGFDPAALEPTFQYVDETVRRHGEANVYVW